MKTDAFEQSKYTARTNQRAWINRTSLIEHGVIRAVINDSMVAVDLTVPDHDGPETCVVPLLTIGSSLFEVAVEPRVGDTVLILHTRNTHPFMHNNPQDRFDTTGDWYIFDPEHTTYGYTPLSGVAILARAAQSNAELSIRHFLGAVPGMSAQCAEYVSATFLRGLSFLFRGQFVDDELKPVSLHFDVRSPLELTHDANVKRTYGLNSEGEPLEEPVEVSDSYGETASITKDIQGAQTFKIGKGKSGDTDAPVSVDIGAKADVTIDSNSALSAKFSKGVTLDADAEKIDFKNSVETLGKLMADFIDRASKLNITGQAIPDPTWIADLTVLKTRFSSLLKS
jgi:hypothetical protein